MTPPTLQQAEQSALRMSRLLPVLSALFLLLLWPVVVETLSERANFASQRIHTEQHSWLNQAVRGIDTRLQALREDMLLYRQPGDGLARQQLASRLGERSDAGFIRTARRVGDLTVPAEHDRERQLSKRDRIRDPFRPVMHDGQAQAELVAEPLDIRPLEIHGDGHDATARFHEPRQLPCMAPCAAGSSATSSNGTASAHFSGVYPLTRSASTEAVSMCFGRIFRTQVSVISPRCVYGAVIFSRTMDTSRSSPLSRPSSRSVVSVSTKMR